MLSNFASWHIPAPHILTPFVSGVEFFGGIFLLLGLLTRISAGALGVTMIVAIASAKWDDIRTKGARRWGRSADVTTIAPFAANLTALAASIPRDPPVTRAT
jgi:uncharacterized membrane protein YphA (DoxX/SURF4 family)